jgi:hypothetical protein
MEAIDPGIVIPEPNGILINNGVYTALVQSSGNNLVSGGMIGNEPRFQAIGNKNFLGLVRSQNFHHMLNRCLSMLMETAIRIAEKLNL